MRRVAIVTTLTMLMVAVGCQPQQQMRDQPRYDPLEPSAFFADGRSARSLPPGVVPRGMLRDDAHLYTGKHDPSAKPPARPQAGLEENRAPSFLRQIYVDTFPFPITGDVMERGRERYTIFCALCHGPLGKGNGKIVERGFTQPPSYHIDRLRDAPAGYIFDVITHGTGAMPDHASQIPPRDRWAIVAYLRALQLSQKAKFSDLPAEDRGRIRESNSSMEDRGPRIELCSFSYLSPSGGCHAFAAHIHPSPEISAEDGPRKHATRVTHPSQREFFRAYLIAYHFWLSIALGSLALLMVQYLTGGAWGILIRRTLEAATRTLPILAVLFVPLLFGIPDLFVWARPEVVEHDPLLQHKSAYLNVPFVLARAAAAFAIWGVLAYFLNVWSREQDIEAVPPPRPIRMTSAVGLLLYGLTVTFFSIDWVMSLEPHWHSTIFPVLIAVGQVLEAFAFAIVVIVVIVRQRGSHVPRSPLSEVVTKGRLQDLGSLLLAFVMLWAYVAFSQYLIIWSADLPEETAWYRQRLGGRWDAVALALVGVHFAVPFLLLLSVDIKRDPRRLALVAVLLLGMRYIDLFWLITPAVSPAGMYGHWLDVPLMAGLGTVWLFFFVRELRRWPLVPVSELAALEAHPHG